MLEEQAMQVEIETKNNAQGSGPEIARPIPLVPEPTADFRERLNARTARVEMPKPAPTPVPVPTQPRLGSRVLIWKQDPSAGEPGLRLAYLPGLVLDGPRDARMSTQLPGTTPVVRNTNGDFVFQPCTPEGDCANAFAVARMTLLMCEQARDGAHIPWAWNASGNAKPIAVWPRAFLGANAFYSRGQNALKFGHFTPTNKPTVLTCRSLDVVSHVTGHAILDGLKPGWLAAGNPAQTGSLHESFADLVAMFLLLSQFDQIDAFVALTKSNLHARNFIAALGEQFGEALGMAFGLRNADSNLRLSEVSNEVHAISQVFTGAIYDILADIFAFEERRQSATKDPRLVLAEVARKMLRLLFTAIAQAPEARATYIDVANKMLSISSSQGDPPIYRTVIRSRFKAREIAVADTPLTMMTRGQIELDDPNYTDGADTLELKPREHMSLYAPQDRSGCCGTMQLPEYVLGDARTLATGKEITDDDLLEGEFQELRRKRR
jgi:hypothetical protein